MCVCVCVCWMGRRAVEEGRGLVMPLPSRALTCHPESPLSHTAHTSLGCQDNGQLALPATPHFLCTELSNHDRCRQYHSTATGAPAAAPACLPARAAWPCRAWVFSPPAGQPGAATTHRHPETPSSPAISSHFSFFSLESFPHHLFGIFFTHCLFFSLTGLTEVSGGVLRASED